MKHLGVTLCLFTVLILVPPTTVNAQGRWGQQRTWGRWEKRSEYGRLFDPASVETITGKLVQVSQFAPPDSFRRGVHLLVKTPDETIPVHLGPDWYVNNQDLVLDIGEQLTIRGSRVTFDDAPAIIAAEIRLGDEVWTFRDEDGVPRWSAFYKLRPRVGRGPCGWGRDGSYGHHFNASTIETLAGAVKDIAYYNAPRALGPGVLMTLKSEHEEIPVHLGPAWFVENQETSIVPNDSVTVRGSRVTIDGTAVIIAVEVGKGDELLELRDENGRPRWFGGRPRPARR